VALIKNHLMNYANPAGKTALVIGTQIPWIEGILLALEAKHITSFDYVQITNSHPQELYFKLDF